MLYPQILAKFENEFALYLPDPDQVKPTYEYLRLKDASTPFPFWAKIWPSAIGMTAFLKKEPHWIEGKQVLELGAGIGLPSFMMAGLASEMIISDHAIEAVKLIEKNIQLLGLENVEACCLDWNNFPDGIKVDTVLLSDINYAPDQFGPLLLIIEKFLAQGTTIILATPQRITATAFVERIQPYIQRTILLPDNDSQQEISISILILSID